MEIISIEKKTFEEMVSRFDELVTRVGALCPKDNDKKMSGWMDSQHASEHKPADLTDITR